MTGGRLRQGRISILAIILVAGCGAIDRPVFEGEVYFPKRTNDPSLTLLARAEGRLVHEGICLWLDSADGRTLLIWNSVHELVWREEELTVLESGTEVARVGDAVELTGGDFSVPSAQVQALIGRPVPAACDIGRFWSVGGLARQDGPT